MGTNSPEVSQCAVLPFFDQSNLRPICDSPRLRLHISLFSHPGIGNLPTRDEFEQSGLSFFSHSTRALESGHDLARVFDTFRPAAQGTGEVGVISKNVHGAVALV